MEPEPLLTAEAGRAMILPIRHPALWAAYKRFEAMRWVAEEVTLERDIADWRRLPPAERVFYSHVFMMFAFADDRVLENLHLRFLEEVKVMEAQRFFTFQADNEAVHSLSYARQLTALFTPAEVEALSNLAETAPAVDAMVKWAEKWLASDAPFATRLLAFALFEGVIFSGMFTLLQFFRDRGIMPGVTSYNELISRDEGVHCEFACLLYRDHVANKLAPAAARGLFEEAVGLFDCFIAEALAAAGGPVTNVKEDLMCRHVRSVADGVWLDAGYEGFAFNAQSPYGEASKLAAQTKTNFFEHTVTQYSHDVDYETPPNPARCGAVGLSAEE